MKGDFSKDSFDLSKNFTRVLMQQGRVQLDADWNEQVSIFVHFLRTLTRDLLGPYAGPEHNCGFGVLTAGDFLMGDDMQMSAEQKSRLQRSIREPGDFLISPGNYYVNGILCRNPDYVPFSKQTHRQHSKLLHNANSPYLIYLEIWEREVSAAEDESIQETALAGADTAERAKIVWQVKSFELKSDPKSLFAGANDCASVQKGWSGFVDHWQPPNRGRLRARAHAVIDSGFADPSTVAPASQYRGLQNQLYRIEIHHAGTPGEQDGPTFKWSRENGSVVFPIVSLAGDPVLTLGNLGRDLRSGLRMGDWVELVDDQYIKERRADPLRQVEKIDAGRNQVTLKGPPSKIDGHPDKHPLLRRWDQKQGDPRRGSLELNDGAALIREGDGDKFWLALENGVQVQFMPSEPTNQYRTGDYWLIPARTATGNVEWPRRGGEPDALPPRGVEHHYAPLAIVAFNPQNVLETQADCRPKFKVPKEYGG